ncbi:hypothetical protein SLEP1_g58193 [Rubroshorea leprosula]|uniref:Uncharacterized protein n=1 Tax=Rubroshorea leprosula TaxID=152421 RepID=A0AAV5MNS3_9ROSI|nr:hypothetical protein SLEP1_g58193 [Rubroshorea leprosula]
MEIKGYISSDNSAKTNVICPSNPVMIWQVSEVKKFHPDQAMQSGRCINI